MSKPRCAVRRFCDWREAPNERAAIGYCDAVSRVVVLDEVKCTAVSKTEIISINR